MNTKTTLRWQRAKTIPDALPTYIIQNLAGDSFGHIYMIVIAEPISGKEIGCQVNWSVDVNGQEYFGDAPTIESAMRYAEKVLFSLGFSMLPEKFKHFE